MNDYRNPWAVDMWSLGCVILEIVVGVPLWMSLPLLVPGKHGSWLQKEGLFAKRQAISLNNKEAEKHQSFARGYS